SLQRLATALSCTFSAYLRRSRGGKTPPGTNEPDSASLQEARVLGRLLVEDGLATETGTLTPRGRFVLHVSGGSEGRLLLRLIESGALAALPTDQQEGLLALLADESPATAASVDEHVLAMYLEAQREQLAAERRAGASVTVPLQPVVKFGGQGSGVGGQRTTGRQEIDLWRRRSAVQDFLERANRAASRAGLALPLPAV
ncbi:MAG TPA: hypothetical protein VGW38_17805, partial [Chloroflexota bacterium]|nr:hypothetical protein [Chloroflexota bacterium]